MKRIVLGFGIILQALLASAQDPQLSQYYASPLYLNPGFAGTAKGHRIIANSRMQWTQLKSAFTTYALSYDVRVDRLNSGFGVQILTDKAGSANLRTTSANAIYASRIHLNEKIVIAPGLSFGYGYRTIDYDKLVMGDQLEFNGPTSDDALNKIDGRSYFDFGTGVLIYSRVFWIGAAAHHINEPNTSILGEDSKLPMKTSVHGGAKFAIKHGPLSSSKLSAVAPSFVYKMQGEFHQLDLGFNLMYDPVLVGLWYRGIPITKNVTNQASQDAIIFILGINLKYLEVGYSYDLTISDVGPSSGGSHELSVKMEIEGWNPRKVKRKDKFLPCPNFTGFKGH